MPLTRRTLNRLKEKALSGNVTSNDVESLTMHQECSDQVMFWEVVKHLAKHDALEPLEHFIKVWKSVLHIPLCMLCRKEDGTVMSGDKDPLDTISEIRELVICRLGCCLRCACNLALHAAIRNGEFGPLDAYFDRFPAARLPAFMDMLLMLLRGKHPTRRWIPLMIEHLLENPLLVEYFRTLIWIRTFLSDNFTPRLIRCAISRKVLTKKYHYAVLAGMIARKHARNRPTEVLDIVPDLLAMSWDADTDLGRPTSRSLGAAFKAIVEELGSEGAKTIIFTPALDRYFFRKSEVRMFDSPFVTAIGEEINKIDRLRNFVSLSITHTRTVVNEQGKEVAVSVLPYSVRLHIKSFWSTRAVIVSKRDREAEVVKVEHNKRVRERDEI